MRLAKKVKNASYEYLIIIFVNCYQNLYNFFEESSCFNSYFLTGGYENAKLIMNEVQCFGIPGSVLQIISLRSDSDSCSEHSDMFKFYPSGDESQVASKFYAKIKFLFEKFCFPSKWSIYFTVVLNLFVVLIYF